MALRTFHLAKRGHCEKIIPAIGLGCTARYSTVRPPVPPFTRETAILKTRMAEDAWNSRDADKVAMAYTEDCQWRNRSQQINGRDEIRAFLKDKWVKEQDYRLIKELWAFEENRIGVRFQYEWHNQAGQWFRSYGNELWEFTDGGLMRRREACINDMAITDSERRFLWKSPGPRPSDHEGLINSPA
eukprot:CFRG4459T1